MSVISCLRAVAEDSLGPGSTCKGSVWGGMKAHNCEAQRGGLGDPTVRSVWLPQGVYNNHHFAGQNPVNESSVKSLTVDVAISFLM